MSRGGVWVVSDPQTCGSLDAGPKLVSMGRRVADALAVELTALLLNQLAEDEAPSLHAYGADRVLVIEHPGLADYHPELYTSILAGLVKEGQPQVLLLADTRVGLDLAPRVAARLHTGLSAHCIDLRVNEHGQLVQLVPAFGLGCVATILCPEHRPQMATVKLGALDRALPNARQGEVVHLAVDLPTDSRVTLLTVVDKPQSVGCELEEAEVVVAGGAGVGSKEGWQLIEKLAERLSAAVGATRPAVDEGWAIEDQLIGHSGKTVRPRLYFAIGISGDILHTVGMKGSQVVVAINSNQAASIFRQADYGLVGDYREILPLLIRRLAA